MVHLKSVGKTRGLLVLLVLLSTLAAMPIQPVGVEAQEPDSIVYRGPNYVDTDLGDDTHSWQSAPQWIFNGSNYVPYIFQDNYAADGFYQVQSGLIGARIYDYYAKFYSPDMSEVRLYDERWEVQRWKNSKWSDIGAQSGSPAFTVSQDETGVNVTKVFTSWAGELTIIYIFREGNPLKHTVYFSSSIAESTQFRVTQKWAGIVAAKVKHDKGEDVITSATMVDSSAFRFLKEDGNLSVFENQWGMYYGYNETDESYYILENQNLKPVEIDVHAQGLKADFAFGNWTLAQGESLEIDPDTSTDDDPTEDGEFRFTEPDTLTRNTEAWGATIGYFELYSRTHRIYFEWSVSSIPDSAIISDTVFIYESPVNPGIDCHIHEMLGARPSTSTDQQVWDEIGEGTVYAAPAGFPVKGNNQQVDLGASADTDLESQLASGDWFAFGVQSDNEAVDAYGGIKQEESVPIVTKPTLYVVYTANEVPTITSVSNPDMDDNDNWYPMKKYYSCVVVVNDADGATDIDKVYLRGKNGAGVLWEVRADNLTGTPVWTIQSGSTIIDLDAGSCTFGEAGNVGTVTFKIRTEWDHGNLADLELAVYVEDSAAASAGWTDKQTNYWDAINRLVTTGFVAPDGRINIGGSTTLSGTVYYSTTTDGYIASSSSPPDGQFSAVYIHDLDHVSRGSDTTIVNGAFSASFPVPDVAQINFYHVYLDLLADYLDADAPDCDESSVVGDRYNVTNLWSSDYSPEWNETFTLYATIESEYDGHTGDVGDTFNVSGVVFTYGTENSRFYKALNYSELGDYIFDSLDAFLAETYGITSVQFGENITVEVINTAPTSPTINNLANNTNCEPSTTMDIDWTFNDVYEPDSQSAYQIQYSAIPTFTNLLYDSNKTVSTSENQEVTFPQEIGEYYIRFKTWDLLDSVSLWTDLLAVEVAHATTEGGWSSGSTVPSIVDPIVTVDDVITPVPSNWSLGIILIVGIIGTGLLYTELNSRKSKKGGAKAFAEKSKGKGPDGFTKKKKKTGGPDEFKKKAKR